MPRLSLHSHATFPALFFLAVEAICLPTVRAQHYLQTNLTADHAGIGTITDLNLVNPWGLSRSAGSPWWVSDNGTGPLRRAAVPCSHCGSSPMTNAIRGRHMD